MERFFKLLYYYFLGLLVLLIVWMTTALVLAPKNDALKRGFIPCTENFVQQVSACERGSLICPAKELWTDTKCNLYVIFDGLGGWVRGQQSSPWANYLFEPMTEAQLSSEDPYVGVVADDVGVLEAQRSFIEAKQQELEEAKHRDMNFDEKVLLSTPEQEMAEQDGYYDEDESDNPEDESGESDIEDEAFMGDVPADEGETSAVTPVEATESAAAKVKAVVKKNSETIKEEIKEK